MTRRTYGQFCALAQALDLVGERWTMLVIRELATGPKRYTDLQEALPGIGTSLLAQRLKDLEKERIVRRRELPPPTPSTVYELTDAGRELRDALIPLVLWGARHALGKPKRGEIFKPEWPLMVLAGMLSHKRIPGPNATWEFRIGGDIAHVNLTGGYLRVASGASPRVPEVVFTSDVATFVDVSRGQTDIEEAMADGRVTVDGIGEDIQRFFEITGPVVQYIAR